MSASQGKKTVVEAETTLRGTLSSSCPVVVLGQVDGEVQAPAVEISAGGVVAGHVKAAALSSAGELAGVIEAETVKLSGRLRDGTLIRARSLDVKLDGAVAFGECQLEVGEAPSKEAAIRQARGLIEPAPEGEAVPQQVPADGSGARSGRRRSPLRPGEQAI
jgi:cytoskeletal protein CcmA (bactofilin family)